ncbi:purine and uridine phosphorylase [Aspergillus pseudodeflectus]|uniref:Purine and uridine phosphorylase n=1 Tax=Aspergillus pseudodeflectus TaxID=176178 RepID=A0ABR4KTU0_9EURO
MQLRRGKSRDCQQSISSQLRSSHTAIIVLIDIEEQMQLQYLITSPDGTQHLDLVEVVADVSVAIRAALKKSPPLYRGLGPSLASLVVEIGSLDFDQQSATARKLRQQLVALADSLDAALHSDNVRAKYHQLTGSKTKSGLRFSLFQSWMTSPQNESYADKWKDFPYPTLGMLSELVASQAREGFHLGDILSDDRAVIDRLKVQVKDWNRLVDLVYDGGLDEDADNATDHGELTSFVKESAFCGEDSIRHLSCTLHDVLHYNWPCPVEDHEHSGLLGHCSSAKLRLDPGWSCRGLDPRGASFFVLLTGSEIMQECRVCLGSPCTVGETGTLVCQVNHEDSRLMCLQLAKDENNVLWPLPLGQPPEALQPDERYIEQSLGTLLDVVKPTYAAKRVLGVILARSFLHLLGGPWIPRSFCIDDISLFCHLKGDKPYPMFDRVFLSTNFATFPRSGVEAKQRSSFSVHPFPPILALGIILTEIELGDDLTQLYSDPAVARLKSRPYELAKCLLRECQRGFHESGLLRAVKFCTERESFLRFANSSIDALFSNQEFVNAFYRGAVRPLEQDLVAGAKWTWEEVKWLERAKFDDEGVCRIITDSPAKTRKGTWLDGDQRQQRPTADVAPHSQGLWRLTSLAEHDSPPALAFEPPCLPSSCVQPLTSWNKCTESAPLLSETPPLPSSKDDFEVAIICALPLEANAVLSLFDHLWDTDSPLTGRDAADPNSYSMGVMEGRNVVLAHQPGMGKATAASVASFCAASFRNVKLALLVGVCGGIPLKKPKTEILLGDVIISRAVMQYDFGRQFSDKFRRKIDIENSLGRPNARIASLLAKLETQVHRRKLQEKISQHLSGIDHLVRYPGKREDKLFPPAYRHKHQHFASCETCANCTTPTASTCDAALESTCADLGCDDAQLVQRTRQNKRHAPSVHIGIIASGDSVIKSGIHRDAISKETGVIGFEMEGAGVWDTIPCVIIKGVCDYADSHKNKPWQDYAAATAAACAKAFVRQW